MSSNWHCKYGRLWMVQWCFDLWFSFGVHIDFKRRINSKYNIPFGNNPLYSSEIGQYIGRGGERADE